MIDLSLIKGQLATLLVFGTTIAYILNGKTTENLLQLIILGGIAWVMYGYLESQSENAKSTVNDAYAYIDKIGKTRKETYLDNYIIGSFPKKGLIFLQKNKTLMDIVIDLKIVHVYDVAGYTNLLVLMNMFQKVYINILIERYYFQSYFATFIDLGEQILEVLYGLYFTLPSNPIQHVYGLLPDALIEYNITRFTVLRRRMITVLESFGKKQLGIEYIPETLPKGNDQVFNSLNMKKLP
jgi:hypothetical protein